MNFAAWMFILLFTTSSVVGGTYFVHNSDGFNFANEKIVKVERKAVSNLFAVADDVNDAKKFEYVGSDVSLNVGYYSPLTYNRQVRTTGGVKRGSCKRRYRVR